MSCNSCDEKNKPLKCKHCSCSSVCSHCCSKYPFLMLCQKCLLNIVKVETTHQLRKAIAFKKEQTIKKEVNPKAHAKLQQEKTDIDNLKSAIDAYNNLPFENKMKINESRIHYDELDELKIQSNTSKKALSVIFKDFLGLV